MIAGPRTPVPICDVTKTRSPDTIGDDTPRPPSGAFHATFSVALHLTGRFFSSVAPVPRGPRHCGQSAADSDAVRAIANKQPRVPASCRECNASAGPAEAGHYEPIATLIRAFVEL